MEEKVIAGIIVGLLVFTLTKLWPHVYGWFAARDVVKSQLQSYGAKIADLRTLIRTTNGPLWNDPAECARRYQAL